MSELPRLQIMFFYISGKFNFISDSITNFYLGLAAQWVIDNFLYFCCTVLKYLWSVILLSMLIWRHLEDHSVERLQLEWHWWVAPWTIALNFLSPCPCICEVNAPTRDKGGGENRKWAALQISIWTCHLKWESALSVDSCCKHSLFSWFDQSCCIWNNIFLLYFSVPANMQNVCMSPFSENSYF